MYYFSQPPFLRKNAHPLVKISLRGVHKYSKSLKLAKISIKISLKFISKKQNTMAKP